MYSPEEREWYFSHMINKLKSINLIEGVVQLGSGVVGYKDDYSDIDLMVSTNRIDEVEQAKRMIHKCFHEMDSAYIKELKFSEDIHLLIAFLDNGLELNVSILPTEYLNVKSPLWKTIFDRTGMVSQRMNQENERFDGQRLKYRINEDIGFEFFYNMRKFNIEVKRNNLIFALKALETMRDLTLQVQVLNENKKLHQFKAYETLHPGFINNYMDTYSKEISQHGLIISAAKLEDLFLRTINESNVFTMDQSLKNILIS